MNTQSIYQEQLFNPTSAGPQNPAVTLVRFAYTVTRYLLAITACTVLLTGSIWAAIEPGLALYLQAFNWSASFVFLAIALEVNKPSTALTALATGITILLLTGLSTRFGLEFALWGTLLICAWLAVAIIKR
ncbi:MAG: hypothetical protein WBS20_03290 [Lysobacterales bacterium]